MEAVEGITLDYSRSPYTGWTRAHWERVLARVTLGYVLAAEKQGSLARALYPDDRRDMPDAVDALESFARISSAWGAWLHHPGNPAELEFGGRTLNLEAILTSALLDGTDPENPRTYWGDIHDMDQRIVEAADISIALWLSRERVFNRMNDREREQIIRWLAQVDGREVYYDNWILFSVLSATVRHKLGYRVDLDVLDRRLDQVAAFYRGDGWYADGTGAEFELYNAWVFGWHYLLWAWIDGARRPDYCERVLRRARSFLAGFAHFFGSNGSYPAWGRSIVYRFAAVSCFAAGHLLGISPLEPGTARRISSGCIKYFYERDCCDSDEHYLRQGFHGDFPPAAEAYISPGSPSWACHGLFALAFGSSDPFWTVIEKPLPVEQADFELALPVPGLAVAGQRETGQVLLLNAGSGHQPENLRNNYVSKYGKFVYSTHFPFNVLPAGHSYAPDAMLALLWNGEWAHRFMNRAYHVAPGISWSEFVEYVGGEPQLIRVAILVWRELQVRLAFLQPTRRVQAVEAPGALGCAGAAYVERRSDPAGWEYAQAEGRAVGIRRLVGYDKQSSSAPFLDYSNINLAYPYVEQPLISEAEASSLPRSLASVSLLSPTAFDPTLKFEGIAVDVANDGSFHVELPDRESAFVSLANQLPDHVKLGEASVTGDGIRAIRSARDGNAFTGLNIRRIEGICELEATGTIRVARTPGAEIRVATNVGIALEPEWVGAGLTRLAARTLEGTWSELTSTGGAHRISTPLVYEWQERNERTLIEFRWSK